MKMRPEMIIEEYRKANDKGEAVKIMAKMNHCQVEDIVDILNEAGLRPKRNREVMEMVEKEVGESEAAEAGKVARKRRTVKKELGSSAEKEEESKYAAKQCSSAASESQPGSSATDEEKQGSSTLPRCVLNALRERYNYLGYSIEEHKKQMIEQSKELAELMEYLDQNGIKEKDLVR